MVPPFIVILECTRGKLASEIQDGCKVGTIFALTGRVEVLKSLPGL